MFGFLFLRTYGDCCRAIVGYDGVRAFMFEVGERAIIRPRQECGVFFLLLFLELGVV